MSMQYQDFLLEEFKSRRSRNSYYSLRAFARDLEMPASKLSQNLRGLCGISVAKAEHIANKLQMQGDERALFLALVESHHARSRVAREQASQALEKLRHQRGSDFSLEMFSTVRDWYHLAILEMVDIKGFRADPAWIAARMGLPLSLVTEAVHRLQMVGLLDISDTNEWRQTQTEMVLSSKVPSRTVREHHKQILTRAIMAIDLQSVDQREYSSQTLAIDQKHVPKLKEHIREFQRQVSRLSREGEKDAVYVMALQLFAVVEAGGT